MNRSVSLPVAILGLIIAAVTGAHAASLDVFYTDFESGIPAGFSPGPMTSRVSSEGYAPYGFGSYMLISQGSTNTGNAVTLTLTGLPAHTSVELDFLLAIINSWDGWEGAPNGHDLFNVEVDGVSVSRNHFSNLWLGNMVNPPPNTSAVFQTNDVAFAGMENGVITHWPDSAYRMTLRTLAHTASTMTIRWYADGGGWQGGPIPTDEFWGIDNLRVRLNNVSQAAPIIATQPASQTVPAGGIAMFSVSASAQPAPQFFWFREGSPIVLGVGSSLSFGPVSAGDAGGYYVVVSNALGSVTSATAQLSLTGNQPPAKNSPLPDQSLAAGSSFNFTVLADTFIDPDVGQTLTWSVGLLPAGLAFNPVTRTFSGVPVAGVHWITVTATDDGTPASSISDTFRLTVTGSSLYEGFDYPAGTAILTRNGGTGWAGPWYNGTYTNAASSLSYPGIPVTGGRAVALPNSVQARRPIHPSVFAPPAPGALPTKYFSVLMRADGALNGWCAIDLVGTAGRALSIGKPFGGQTGMYVLETGPQQTPSTYPVVSGSNALLVVKCEFFSGNDRFTLYVNPVPGEPPPPPAATKFDHDVGTTFTNLMISSSIACSIDELRVGDTFAEVVPALCPPVFLAQPTNTTAAIGLPLVLSAPAAGQGPIAYQWRKDGVPLLNNGPITGADTGTLVIPSASMTDSGDYDVAVTGPCDTLTSQVARVTVQGLAFVTQPVSQAVRPGSNATFSVTVSSASPVTYQWQFNGVNIENAINSTLTLPNAQVAQRGNYRCVAHNNLGDFPSAEAYLEVMVAPTFVQQPQNLTVAVGANATFTAAVTNTASVPILFTLRKGSVNLVNPPPQTLMSTSCTFTLANVQLSDAGGYRIVATNIAGQLLGSSAATLTVMEPPVITSQPQSMQVAAGAPASFSVTATGGVPLTYQWRRNGDNLNDATNSTLLISAAATGDAGDYTVAVSNPVGSVTSTVAILSLEQIVVPLVVSPAVTNVLTGGTVAFAVSGGTAPYAFALAANGSGGNITSAGHYTAGSAAGLDLVQVTDADGSNATAVVTVLGCAGLAYEAALNSLPSAQGWTHQSSGSAEANYALTGGALLQGDTAPAEQTQYYQSAGVAFDFTTQTVVAEARVRINQSELIPPGTSPAPRAGWGLQLIDSAGRLVTLFVGGSGCFLLGQNDQASALMSLDATAAFHTFRLVANSAGASVSVDGVPQASLNFSQFRLDGAALANSLILGDLTTSATSSSQLTRFHVATLCPPPPLALTPEATNTVSGGTIAFTATGGTPPYTFTLTTNHSGGSVTAAGNYTAGPGCGTDTLVLTDSAGSNAPATILVSDATPPVVACPADITVEAATPAGTTVDFVVTASDVCTAHPILVVSPPSGSEFSLGTNVVTCQATDAAGNVAACSFKIIVRDTTPPGIACPANISVTTDNPAGATVNFVVSASDLADTSVGIVCTPASGSVFPPGTTTVNCVATDDAGNTSGCSFTVAVAVVPTAFAVSGRVAEANNTPVAGVTVTLTGSGVNTSTLTDAGGNYVFGSIASGTYNLSASHPNFNVMPASASVTMAGANEIRDFSALRTSFAIRGRVTDCVTGAGVPGVRVGATGVKQRVFTDPDGSYLLPKVPLLAKVYVQPSQQNAAIEPGSAGFTAPTSDVIADFCSRSKVQVRGLVLDADGVGLNGTTVLVNGSVTTSVQVQKGRFSLTGLEGQSLTLTPTNQDYLFSPPSQSFPNLMRSVSVTFRGTPLPELGSPGLIAADFGRLWSSTYFWAVFSPGWVSVTPDDRSSYFYHLGERPYQGRGYQVAWTRDGTRLAFVSEAPGDDPNGASIYVMNADGSGVTRLNLVGYYPQWPAWSPDGTQLIYWCRDANGGMQQLMLVNSDGSNPRMLAQSAFVPEYHYYSHWYLPGGGSWSPDGTEVAYPVGNRIYRIKVVSGGGDPSPPALETPYDGLVAVGWSPDGRQFACLSPSRCFTIRTNGGPPTLDLPGYDSIAWSPDGNRLAVTKNYKLYTVRTNGTDWRSLPAHGVLVGPHSWGSFARFRTQAGANTTVGHATTTVSFENVTQSGETIIHPLSSDSTTLPPGYFSFGGSNGVQIETTAQTTGPITVCFKVPEATSEATFNRLRIFHGESGVLVDRTILPPDSPPPNYATRTICARVSSLSPFVIGEQIDTALPQVTGVVVDTNGNPIVDAFVLLTGSATNDTQTDLDGRFAFPNLSATGNYTVAVAKAGLGFTPAEMNLPALGAGADILFVGTNTPPRSVPPLAIAPDARFGNQPTLTWPGLLYEFQLESTDSLNNPEWGVVPELQLPVETGTAVPLAPTENQRYFRLRQP